MKNSLLARTILGPTWAQELLDQLKTDPRFKDRLLGLVTWEDVPVSDQSCVCDLNPLLRSSKEGTVVYFSSGSTGTPKRVDFNVQDWDAAVHYRASCLSALGIGSGDRAAVMLPHGPWFSGDNITDALLSLGTQVLSGGMYLPHLNANIQLIKRLNIDTIITTPSIALAMTSSHLRLVLKNLVLVGENLDTDLRAKLSDWFGAAPRSIFAASEAILGYEDPVIPKLFHWDPEEVFLEVIDDSGQVRQEGAGQLLVTKRYGIATPLLRYMLGDRVELLTEKGGFPTFRFLGRVGHGFSLTTGVKVTRAQLDHFLDKLHVPIANAKFLIHHAFDGTDHVTINISTPEPDADFTIAEESFKDISIDVADVASCGYLKVSVEGVPYVGTVFGKRKIDIIETPWQL